MLSHDYLISVLEYNPETGVFKWKVTTSPKAVAGSLAGYINNGYLKIGINGKQYPAHRLAWFYYYKEWPKNQIDHIDRNRQNNAITNLRDVSGSVNAHNQTIDSTNTSGAKGVYYSHQKQRWVAYIIVNRKNIYLGHFMDFKFAVKARRKAEKQYGVANELDSSRR